MSRRERRSLLFSMAAFFAGLAAAMLLGLPWENGVPAVLRIAEAVRLPETVTVLLVGGGLGLSGLLFQLVLRNPLADPYVLGVAGGATFGSVVVLLFTGTAAAVVGFPFRGTAAFVGGFLTLLALLKLSGGKPGTLLLGGVIANTAFAAASRVMTVFFSPTQLTLVTAYLVGFIPTLPLWVPALLVLPVAYTLLRFWSAGRGLDLLLLSDEEASSLGLAVESVRKEALVLATLLACLAVSLCGMLGFVGLVVPHAARLMSGHRHRVLVPASFLLGASFLLYAHAVGKLLSGTWFLPVGVYTSLVGAPVFLLLLLKTARRNWA